MVGCKKIATFKAIKNNYVGNHSDLSNGFYCNLCKKNQEKNNKNTWKRFEKLFTLN
jgi:hypothetical protein